MEQQEGNKIIAVIYKITNIVNGKFYIGSSVNFIRRRKRHLESLKSNKHHCKPLQRAFNKYGVDNFVITIIEKFSMVTRADILQKEQYFLDTMKPEYNVCLTAGSQLGSKRSNEFKKNCSERWKGKPTWNKGLKLPAQTEAHKLKRGKALKGKKRNEATRLLMSEKKKGIKFTEEHKDKLSKSHIKNGKYVRR